MNETVIRIISGAVYAGLLLLSIFISEYTFIGLVFVFGIITLHELLQLLNLKSYLAYILLVAAFIFFSFYHYLGYRNLLLVLMILTLILNVLLIRDLLIIREIPLFERRKYLIIIFYLISSLVFLTLLPYAGPEKQYTPQIVISVFVLIWTNDSFAYLIGKSFGRRKLFERISPNKTVEGFMGGLLFTFVASYLIYRYAGIFPFEIWFTIALITGIFGTFGDLIQSKLKRQAGVKDSGHLMPGHGGLLDRLDSIIFAVTFIYSFLVIYNNVS